MSNLKHGFYSTNTSINPDSIMMNNALVKDQLKRNQQNIIDVVQGKIVRPGVADLVVRLIDCALPHADHLLPKHCIAEIEVFHRSRAFRGIANYIKNRSLQQLIDTVNSHAKRY